MAGRQQTPKYHLYKIGEFSIPVAIIEEQRAGYRFSFAKRGVNVRLPIQSTVKFKQETVKLAESWILKTLLKKPHLVERYTQKQYTNGHLFRTFNGDYTLVIQKNVNRKSLKSYLKDDYFVVELPKNEPECIITKKFIARSFGVFFKDFFIEQADYWNQFFPLKYNTLRVKYNSTNWGSCSSKQNINLSSRLLLCPLPVIDYVIVHELAHLEHKNHSKAFWREVKRVLPDYEKQNYWLKTHGTKLDF